MIAPREELGGAERGKNKERIQRKQENRPYAVTNVGRVMYRTSSVRLGSVKTDFEFDIV